MQSLTEKIYHLNPPGGVFNETVLRSLFPERSEGARKLLVQRAIGFQEVLRLKPGLFCLAEPFRRSHPHPFMVANLLLFPSHVSMESALRHHGMIPEAVREVTSVTSVRSRNFSNALSHFSYKRMPAIVPRAGVRITDLGGGMTAHIATTVRAIADLVYTNAAVQWKTHGMGFLTQSMRMEWEDLTALAASDFEEVANAIKHKRTLAFITALRRELGIR